MIAVCCKCMEHVLALCNTVFMTATELDVADRKLGREGHCTLQFSSESHFAVRQEVHSALLHRGSPMQESCLYTEAAL